MTRRYRGLPLSLGDHQAPAQGVTRAAGIGVAVGNAVGATAQSTRALGLSVASAASIRVRPWPLSPRHASPAIISAMTKQPAW